VGDPTNALLPDATPADTGPAAGIVTAGIIKTSTQIALHARCKRAALDRQVAIKVQAGHFTLLYEK
jgi:hypothetical protein